MDIIISDASAVLRNLPWPGTGGLVSDFINTVLSPPARGEASH